MMTSLEGGDRGGIGIRIGMEEQEVPGRSWGAEGGHWGGVCWEIWGVGGAW